ncbi:tyrosine-type recombinase/integrase [Burkholderia sp. Ac-20345]|uniref:tyrosine-type recombinase/integrase n=1 Tax=Burkholderia sp. Ac-20345 TaxID=2703891 RepID=UPI00197B3A5C|nr:tyrosine-type recombinase/integrase [Burkholderia sp. Ac-20345]
MGGLTVKQIEAAKATGKLYFLSDGRGLFLRIGPDGSKTWLVRVSINGKQRDKPLGKAWGRTMTDERLSLEDARAAAATIRSQARDGVDYLEAEKRERQAKVEKATTAELTFGDLFDTWFATVNKKRGKKGRKDGGRMLRSAMEKHVLPALRTHKIAGVFASNVLPLLTAISDAGYNRRAVEVLGAVQQMIRWGERNQPWKRLLIDCDVLALAKEDVVAGDYDPVRDNERHRTLSDDEIRALGELMPAARLPRSIESAVWVMLACGTRVGETLVTRWADLDFKARTWRIPKEHTKSSAAITIHLSDFVLAQFAAQQIVRAGLPEGDVRREYVFPSQQGKIPHVTIHTTCKAIRDRQRGKGVSTEGRTTATDTLIVSGGQWKCHDLRRTCATMMQSLGIPESVVHRCLNHARNEPLDRIYLQFDYGAQMRDAWQRWGDRLSELLGEDTRNVRFLFKS